MSMIGQGKWEYSVQTGKRSRLKAQRKSSKGKSLLSKKKSTSGSGESAAVHFAQTSLLSFGDKSEKSDNDPSVAKTVEMPTVAGCDVPALIQGKEARFSGGIPSQ